LFLGEDALGLVDRKLDDMRAEIDRWEALSRSTGFDAHRAIGSDHGSVG
jgi:hypothetical protein